MWLTAGVVAIAAVVLSILSAPSAIGVLGAGLALVAMAIAVVDWRSFVIPDALNAAGFSFGNGACGRARARHRVMGNGDGLDARRPVGAHVPHRPHRLCASPRPARAGVRRRQARFGRWRMA